MIIWREAEICIVCIFAFSWMLDAITRSQSRTALKTGKACTELDIVGLGGGRYLSIKGEGLGCMGQNVQVDCIDE